MVEVPVALLVAEWLLLLGLAATVYLMYRQLAYLLKLSRAVSGSGGLSVGEQAPSFEYTVTAGDGTTEPGRFSPKGTPTLLMFTTPSCGSCELALRNLEKATRRRREDGLRVLAVTDAQWETVQAVDAFRKSTIPVVKVLPEVPSRLFHVYTTPFLYAIGHDGTVRGTREAVTTGQINEVMRELRDDGRP